MTEQLTIDGGERIIGLTERQEHALREVERLGGATLVEVGQAMHARRGKHAAEYVCSWCQDEGASVVHELSKKGLVKRQRGGVWRSTRALGAGDPGASLTSPGDARGAGPSGLSPAPSADCEERPSDAL